mmetsp:Transcript_25625/g.72553  ORF Transcript_25625/g.72553 Transcript_25625/m.72553 type:complete len:212 (+) Transcript_25625:130-765(+)
MRATSYACVCLRGTQRPDGPIRRRRLTLRLTDHRLESLPAFADKALRLAGRRGGWSVPALGEHSRSRALLRLQVVVVRHGDVRLVQHRVLVRVEYDGILPVNVAVPRPNRAILPNVRSHPHTTKAGALAIQLAREVHWHGHDEMSILALDLVRENQRDEQHNPHGHRLGVAALYQQHADERELSRGERPHDCAVRRRPAVAPATIPHGLAR